MALKPSRSEGVNSGCNIMLWMRSLMPAGVFPKPIVIHESIRSSEIFVELVRRLFSGSEGGMAIKPDPMDWEVGRAG